MPKLTEATKEARRKQILEAAMECFVETGYSTTTMAQIIEKSGLSSGSIYSHFESKEEILRGVIDTNLSVVKNTYSADRNTITPRYVAYEFSQQLELSMGAKVMLSVWSAASSLPELGEVIQQTITDITGYIAGLLTPWAEQNCPPDVVVEDFALRTTRATMAVVHGVTIRLSVDKSVDARQLMDDAFRLLPGE